jgi:hypothetical protein
MVHQDYWICDFSFNVNNTISRRITMRLFYLPLITFFLFIFACSNGSSGPVLPESNTDVISQDDSAVIGEASDVLFVSGSSDVLAYKAFGIYQVTIDPVALTGEIIPARNASAIGATFDADLTQFLTVTPCRNCLQINGIQLTSDGNVNVGFKVKHPFGDPAKRPDLHGFDVRGIVLAEGNFFFMNTLVNLTDTDTAPVKANVNLLVNPDGYTHHFDELATDTHYFDPPRDYDANINPYKRYFEDSTAGAFDFANPSGHNVMPCGSDWETQVYTFDLQPGAETLDFGFIVDCAYGASAVLKNRFTPWYFLPEFNRKEAWKVETIIATNDLQSAITSSTASLTVAVCDWQAGLTADPNYPDTTNLYGIKAKSDVASVNVEIPFVSSLTSVISPASGTGSGSDPYIYNLTVTNTLAASAGTYFGIVAVRDDLQGQVGPIGIPESPAGFPYEGPEIYDYSTYNVFSIRVYGTVPDVASIDTPIGVYEGDVIQLNAMVNESDGDDVTYLWEQVSPASPEGIFADPTVKNATYIVPALDDVALSGVAFTLNLTATDADGWDSKTVTFTALENNHAPVCMGIDTDPLYGVIRNGETMSLYADGYDADGDDLIYEWDMNYDGSFSNDELGPEIVDYSWADQGFYNVACKITEDRTNALEDWCTRMVIQEGIINDDFQIDEEAISPLPNWSFPDTEVTVDARNNPTYHVIYQNQDDDRVVYCNNEGNPRVFTHHEELAPTLASGWTGDSKLAVNGNTLIAMWVETVTVPSTVASIKVRVSEDNGTTWGSAVTVTSVNNPDSISRADICGGSASGEFYIFFAYYDSPTYACMVIKSLDNGDTWDFPGAPSNGQFRDSVSLDSVLWINVAVSPNGVLHAVWLNHNIAGYSYYYDYSVDGGNTWHTDMLISSGDPYYGEMRVSNDGDMHFVYGTDTGFYYVNTDYGDPPVLGTTRTIYSTGAADANGVSLAISPDASVIVAVVDYQDGLFYRSYFFSYNHGVSWDSYTKSSVTDMRWSDCTGWGASDPGRSEIFNVWIDYRTSSWQQGHIYGEYLYLADRF